MATIAICRTTEREGGTSMILGLFETHIDVADLDRARRFYSENLGLELGLLDQERRVAFYWVGPRGESMLGLWEKPAGQILPQHFAFRATVEDVLTHAVPYLKQRGLEPRNFLDDGGERPMVFGWMPALAIYFRDPDGHSLEFIAMLPDEPRPEVGVVSWEEWLRLHDREHDAEPAAEDVAQ
jgi:catechol 2,3-dioxygenase-like lactoylglutathione lyase family enzyme